MALGAGQSPGLHPCAESQPVCPWEHFHWPNVPPSELDPRADQPEPSHSKNVVEFSPMKVHSRQPCRLIPFEKESKSKEAEAGVTDLRFCHQKDFGTWVDIRCLKYSWVFDPYHVSRV